MLHMETLSQNNKKHGMVPHTWEPPTLGRLKGLEVNMGYVVVNSSQD